MFLAFNWCMIGLAIAHLHELPGSFPLQVTFTGTMQLVYSEAYTGQGWVRPYRTDTKILKASKFSFGGVMMRQSPSVARKSTWFVSQISPFKIISKDKLPPGLK